MYGGISLCVYMNGIADALLRLVRSTARQDWNDPRSKFLYPDAALTQTELVYRRVAAARSLEDSHARRPKRRPRHRLRKVQCRFVVDVLSGTSAGGLNNLFLARALANEEPLGALAKLWIEEGEIARLVNDKGSQDPDVGLSAERPPRSLLNSQRMAQRLLEAMRTMEDGAQASGASRLVRRLDLYMTATDLKGLDQSLEIPSDDTITESQHRAVFHFVHDPLDGGYLVGQTDRRNDFDPRVTPFLTFVARSTSCIVPAFEPMRLDDVGALKDPAVPALHYDRDASPLVYSAYFRNYWRNAERLRAKGSPNKPARSLEEVKRAFRYRAFGDGGYGDNYPFGYAVDEVARRTSDVRVDRKLLYVEPDPELPEYAELPLADPGRPSVVDHAQSAFGVKSSETIRGDIQAIRDRNRLLERVEAVRRAAGSMEDEPMPPPVAYWKLCASAATDELAELLAAVIGFEPDTPYGEAVRAMVKAIRKNVYGDGLQGVGEFLDCFDLASLRRRIAYERREILDRCRPRAEDRKRLTQLAEFAVELHRLPALVRTAAAAAQERAASPVPDPERPAVTRPTAHRRATLAAKMKDRDLPVDAFLEAFDQLGPAVEGDPSRHHIALEELGAIVVGNPVRWHECGGAEPDAKRVAAAWRLLSEDGGETRVKAAVQALCLLYSRVVGPIRQWLLTEDGAPLSEETLASAHPTVKPLPDALKKEIASRWGRAFRAADQITFPALYGAGQAESAHIDVLRVSPLDCKTLVPEAEKAKTKLAGTGLGHFSGFFRDVWRAEDILWGRLDGAERLICTVLRNGTERRKLILQAQVAILAEATDLEATIQRLEDARPATERLEPQNGVPALRRKLLLLALDRFVAWAVKAPEGGTAPVEADDGLARLIAPLDAAKDPKDPRYPALCERLLDAAWEGF